MKSHGTWWRWIGGVAVVVGLVLLARWLHFDGWLASFVGRVNQFGAWGPVLFVLFYVVACIVLVPGSPLTVGAGAIFGVVWGTVWVLIGATLGATAAFLVGRYCARGWVARRIEGNPTFSTIDKAVAAEGWKIVFLARLSPVFPFAVLNYAFGLTHVPLCRYVTASFVGMFPGTVMYVYVGSAARAAGERNRTTGEWMLYGAGLAATIAVTVLGTRIARRALAQRTTPK